MDIVWGSTPEKSEELESSDSTSFSIEAKNAVPMSSENEAFRNAIENIHKLQTTEFLLILPFEKLRYRIPNGNFEGYSYLWLIAHNVCKGRSGVFEQIYQKMTIDDLRTKERKGKQKDITLLWKLCHAATLGHTTP